MNRLKELEIAANALLVNARTAITIRNPFYRKQESKKLMKLVVCGRLFGTGKSTFGEPLSKVLAAALKRTVHYVCTESYPVPDFAENAISATRFSGVLYELLAELPQFERLHEQSISIKKRLNEIEAILLERDEFLFLHLDEFHVDSMNGEYFRGLTGIARLYEIWTTCFVYILACPRVFLFVSGKSTYFNEIGGKGQSTFHSPTFVHSVRLNGLSERFVLDSLQRLYVREKRSAVSVTSLSTCLFGNAKNQEKLLRDFATNVAHCAGGVPRYFQFLVKHALSRQLTNRLSGSDLIRSVSAEAIGSAGSVAYDTATELVRASSFLYVLKAPLKDQDKLQTFAKGFYMLLGCITMDTKVAYNLTDEQSALFPGAVAAKQKASKPVGGSNEPKPKPPYDVKPIFEAAMQLSVYYDRVDSTHVRFVVPPLLKSTLSAAIEIAINESPQWSTIVNPGRQWTGEEFETLVSMSILLDSCLPALCQNPLASRLATTKLLRCELRPEVATQAESFDAFSALRRAKNITPPSLTLPVQSFCEVKLGKASRRITGVVSNETVEIRLSVGFPQFAERIVSHRPKDNISIVMMRPGPQSEAPDLIYWWGNTLIYAQVKYWLHGKLERGVILDEMVKTSYIDRAVVKVLGREAEKCRRVFLLIGQFLQPEPIGSSSPSVSSSDHSSLSSNSDDLLDPSALSQSEEAFRNVLSLIILKARSEKITPKKRTADKRASQKKRTADKRARSSADIDDSSNQVSYADVLEWINDPSLSFGIIQDEDCTALTVGAYFARDMWSSWKSVK